MYILVMPNGSKYFRLDFRLNGKRQTLALGVYPTTTLDNARLLRDTAKGQIKDGIKPNINDGINPSISVGKHDTEVPKKMSFAEECNEQRKLTDKLGREAGIAAFSMPRIMPDVINDDIAKLEATTGYDSNKPLPLDRTMEFFMNPSKTDTVNKTVHAQTDTVSSLNVKLDEEARRNADLQGKLAAFFAFSKLTQEQKDFISMPDSHALIKLKELTEKRVIDLSEISTSDLLKEIARRAG